jgi:hypothetical protein
MAMEEKKKWTSERNIQMAKTSELSNGLHSKFAGQGNIKVNA